MLAPGPVRRRQRGAGRVRPTVQRASLPLPLPVSPSATEVAALLRALIKHLLFQRAQIPYLYDELLRSMHTQQAEAEAEAAAAAEAAAGGGRPRRRRRSPKSDKRLLKFLCKAEELLASIDAALAACGVPRRAFLLLGSSSAKPREVFEVLLPQPAVPQGPAAAMAAMAGGPPCHQPGTAGQEQPPAPHAANRAARPSRQQRLCQLAVRHLVVGAAELPEGTAHTVPCKLYVLLEGPPVAAADAAGAAADMAADSAGDAAAVQVPPGFTTKRQFRLSMRKGTHVRLLLGQHAEEDEEQQRVADQQRRQAEEQAPASSEASMGGSSSCSTGEGDGVTVHLSQLPDAASQEQVAEVDQQSSGGGAAYGPPAAAGPARGASDTAGSVWFMARTVLKGLNSGGGSSGVAAGFDGL